MKITRIQYTVSSAFAQTNKKNIGKVMDALKALNRPEIRYSSYCFDDGKTFMHVFIAPDDEAKNVINSLDEFKHFQTELRGSSPEVPPQFENLTLVGSTYNLMG